MKNEHLFFRCAINECAMLINEVTTRKITIHGFSLGERERTKKIYQVQKVYQFELQVKLQAGRAQNNDIATLTNSTLLEKSLLKIN